MVQDEQQLWHSTWLSAVCCYSCGESDHIQQHVLMQHTEGYEPMMHSTTMKFMTLKKMMTKSLTIPPHHMRYVTLVLCRTCLTPQGKWFWTNFFCSTCTIKRRICSFVIDTCSSRNIISEEAVDKLGIARETHLPPYTLRWHHENANLHISIGPLHQYLILPSAALPRLEKDDMSRLLLSYAKSEKFQQPEVYLPSI